MDKYRISQDLAKEGSKDFETISVAERLEGGSIRFHESIVVPKKETEEEQEKERNKILQEISQKYKD